MLFLAIPFNALSQDQNVKNDAALSLQGFQSKSSEMNFLANQNYASNKSTSNSSNFVNIKQVGSFNQVRARTSSEISEIDLIQNGDYNHIDLNINAFRINEKIIQNGNLNILTDINTFGSNFHEAEVIQNGNNQSITRYGSNSISEKMKVNMQGNDKILVIRNFN